MKENWLLSRDKHRSLRRLREKSHHVLLKDKTRFGTFSNALPDVSAPDITGNCSLYEFILIDPNEKLQGKKKAIKKKYFSVFPFLWPNSVFFSGNNVLPAFTDNGYKVKFEEQLLLCEEVLSYLLFTNIIEDKRKSGKFYSEKVERNQQKDDWAISIF